MWQALDQWGKYLHDDSPDPLIQAALMHAQFENHSGAVDRAWAVGPRRLLRKGGQAARRLSARALQSGLLSLGLRGKSRAEGQGKRERN